MRRRWIALLPLVLAPGAVEACASCISSAYGDRTYNWAYIGLMLAPFAVTIGIGAVLTRCYLAARRPPGARPEPRSAEETP